MKGDIEVKKAVHRAVKTVGSVRALAEALGVEPARVTMWKHRSHIPAKFVISVERVSGVARHKLRPDIYPPEEYEGLC